MGHFMPSDVLDRKLSLPELAKAWGWSPDKLRRLVEQQAIPHTRIRNRIYFELDRVERWWAAYRRAELRQIEREITAHDTAERSRLDERRALGLSDEETFGM